MTSRPGTSAIGIGPTVELSLRVSVAALARVILEHPETGTAMLALERRATLQDAGTGHVQIKSQPFGGAIRIHDLDAVQRQIGDFRFDSEDSRLEQDFRIFIRPSTWQALRAFCLRHLGEPNNLILESDPARELTEEFADTLAVQLKPEQYAYQAIGTILENDASPTGNLRARGYPTVRVYRIFEARVLDSALASEMVKISERCSDPDLREHARTNLEKGGRGTANAVLTLPLEAINEFYSAVQFKARNEPVTFRDHLLDETVAAILDGVAVPKFLRV
jgi:hypothetical protein